MTIELTGILVKHERRLRLIFSNTLAAGAFGSPAPAAYVIESADGKGPNPNVSAAIIVSGATTNVELALDTDLVQGALYHLTAIGVPAADLSTSTSASDQHFRFGEKPQRTNVEPKASHAERLLYGSDAVWANDDYLEDMTGDMDEAVGVANADAALRRRMLSNGVAWNRRYGAKGRRYVDAPSVSIGGFKGDLELQALEDDRVKSCAVKLELDASDPGQSTFVISPVYRGGHIPEPIALEVPT